MPRIFHVSDGAPVAAFTPRPAPPGALYEGRVWVWGVGEDRLPNYLPRQCPRVCWVPPMGAANLLGSPAGRVIAIEHGWLPKLFNAGLQVHELEPSGFTGIDETAGYWIADELVAVRSVHRVDDCVAALAVHGVELRLATSLRPYVDAVVAADGQFSVIRMRNADSAPS